MHIPTAMKLFLLVFFVSIGSNAGAEDKTKLERTMSATNKAFKTVRRQSSDSSKNKESAKLVEKMIENSKRAIKLKPKWTVDQPKDEQKAYVEGYKKEMQATIKLLERLKIAFERGKNNDANNIIADIRQQQKKNHKKYKKPDED